MFLNREDAGKQLAARLSGRSFRKPVVLAIPRGGVIVGAALAKELGAELDVALSRKLRAPHQPELAVGAISEEGEVILTPEAEDTIELGNDYLHAERQRQLAEIARRKHLIRQVRPQAELAARSVIVTDDGIATGSTMRAALQSVRAKLPHELIVAVPVASPDRLSGIRHECDEILCLLEPDNFFAIGQFYDDFPEVEDEQMIAVLRESLGDYVRTALIADRSHRS